MWRCCRWYSLQAGASAHQSSPLWRGSSQRQVKAFHRDACGLLFLLVSFFFMLLCSWSSHQEGYPICAQNSVEVKPFLFFILHKPRDTYTQMDVPYKHTPAFNPHQRNKGEMDKRDQEKDSIQSDAEGLQSEWLKACRAFSYPMQVVTLQDRAAAAEWSVCWQKLLNHQRCRRPEEAASRPLTDSDQSAYINNASRAISSEIIPPWSAKVTVLISFPH